MKRFHYIFHALAYNIAWLACMLLAAEGSAWLSTIIVLLLVSTQYYWQFHIYHQSTGLNLLVILITIAGTLIDTLMLFLT